MPESDNKLLLSALERFKNGEAKIDDIKIISEALASDQIEIIPSGDSRDIRQFGGANFGESNDIRISGSVIGTQIVSNITADQVREIIAASRDVAANSIGFESTKARRANVIKIIGAIIGLSVIAVVLVSGYNLRTLYAALYPTPTPTSTSTPTATNLPTETKIPTYTHTPTLTPSITPPPNARETSQAVRALPDCSSQVVGVETAEMTNDYGEIPESTRMVLVDFSLNTRRSSFYEVESEGFTSYSCCDWLPGDCFDNLDANRLLKAFQDYASSSGKQYLLEYIPTTQELMHLHTEYPGIADQLIPGPDEWQSLSPENCNMIQSWVSACTMLESPVFTVVIKNNSDEQLLITKILYRMEDIYEVRGGGAGLLDPQVMYIHNIHYARGDQEVNLEKKFYIDPHFSGSFDLQLRTDDPGDGLTWSMSIYFIDEYGAAVHTGMLELVMSGPPQE